MTTIPMNLLIEVASELILRNGKDSSTKISWSNITEQTNTTKQLKEYIKGRKLSLDEKSERDALIDCFKTTPNEQKFKLYKGFWHIICAKNSFDAFSDDTSTAEVSLNFTKSEDLTEEQRQEIITKFTEFLKTDFSTVFNTSVLPTTIWDCPDSDITQNFLLCVSIIVSGKDYNTQPEFTTTTNNPNYLIPLFVLYNYFANKTEFEQIIDQAKKSGVAVSSAATSPGDSTTTVENPKIKKFEAAIQTALLQISEAAETFATESSSSPGGGDASLRAQIVTLKTQVTELEGEVAAKKTELSTIQEELNVMKKEKNEAEASSSQFEEQFTKLNATHATTTKELADAKTKIESYEARITELEETLRAYQKLEELVKTPSELQTALEDPSQAQDLKKLYTKLTTRNIEDDFKKSISSKTAAAKKGISSPQVRASLRLSQKTPAKTLAPSTLTQTPKQIQPILLEHYNWRENFEIPWLGTEILKKTRGFPADKAKQEKLTQSVTSNLTKVFEDINKTPLADFVLTSQNRDAIESIKSDNEKIADNYYNLKDIQARIQLVCLKFLICSKHDRFTIFNTKNPGQNKGTKFVVDIIFAIAINAVKVLQNESPLPFDIEEPRSNWTGAMDDDLIKQIVIFLQCFNVTIETSKIESLKSTPLELFKFFKKLFETDIVRVLFDFDTWNYISIVQKAQTEKTKSTLSSPQKLLNAAINLFGIGTTSTSVASASALKNQETFRRNKEIYTNFNTNFITHYVFGVQLVAIAAGVGSPTKTVDYDQVKPVLLKKLNMPPEKNPFKKEIEEYKSTVTEQINAVDTPEKITDAEKSVEKFNERVKKAIDSNLLDFIRVGDLLEKRDNLPEEQKLELGSRFKAMKTEYLNYFEGTSSNLPDDSDIESLTEAIRDVLKTTQSSPSSSGGGNAANDIEAIANKFLADYEGTTDPEVFSDFLRDKKFSFNEYFEQLKTKNNSLYSKIQKKLGLV